MMTVALGDTSSFRRRLAGGGGRGRGRGARAAQQQSAGAAVGGAGLQQGLRVCNRQQAVPTHLADISPMDDSSVALEVALPLR